MKKKLKTELPYVHKDITEGLRYKFEFNSPVMNENLKFTRKWMEVEIIMLVKKKPDEERKIYFLPYAECSVL